ncbi:DUF2785 domain-containing protein [Thalassotalea castellviae]|uniref:DUF2785 domain-containing protein n=1 Tax=Thalassotalea castellviae TaxID=3075612 RepID=A0ABU3A2Z8_9GAMM|nr:DUF2785 domain-containing protein [Thalassotalea sp. W431]MDT0604542.1 DUF2785 domain-containing protein [Thalassotalea sp. W431]
MLVSFNTATLAADKNIVDAANVAKRCQTSTYDKKALLLLKEQNFLIKDTEEKTAVAKQLLDCLASPDPVLRDEIAFTGLSQWLRANDFNADFYLAMLTTLSNVISADVKDEYSVYQPFAILMLSEVARVDRKSPFLTDVAREKLVALGTKFLRSVDDYRGYHATIGWRHSVAHTADLMLQLSLNPAITKQHLDHMLSALLSQVVAKNDHFYIYGEPKRLAMPVIYIFLNDEYTIENWQTWLNDLTNPAPLKSWGEVYSSQTGLSKLHNTQNFLFAIYALIKNSNNERLSQMVPALENAIKKIQ